MRAPPPKPLIRRPTRAQYMVGDRAVSMVPRVKTRAATIRLVRTDQIGGRAAPSRHRQ